MCHKSVYTLHCTNKPFNNPHRRLLKIFIVYISTVRCIYNHIIHTMYKKCKINDPRQRQNNEDRRCNNIHPFEGGLKSIKRYIKNIRSKTNSNNIAISIIVYRNNGCHRLMGESRTPNTINNRKNKIMIANNTINSIITNSL